jgi:hypothetical protein
VPYIVLHDFIEKEHENTHYKKGEIYPKEGFEANSKRVDFLLTDKNKYKKPFLKADEKKLSKSDGKNKGKVATVTNSNKVDNGRNSENPPSEK